MKRMEPGKPEIIDKQITILYGSETGTAQDTAEEIWKNFKRRGMTKFRVSSMDEYGIEQLLDETYIIFVVSTTGQGDPPKNMRRFWKYLLRRNLSSTLLSSLNFAVLGLGDSSYQKFNFAAKKLNKRLLQLGAKEIVPIGLADDQHDLGIDGTVGDWIGRLFETLNLPEPLKTDPRDIPIVYRFDLEVIEGGSELLETRDVYHEQLENIGDLRRGRIVLNSRTTHEDHFQDVRLIGIRGSQELDYSPGDVLYVRPRNSKSKVAEFFRVLRENGVTLNPKTLIRLKELEIQLPLVLRRELTLERIVEQYWDLSFRPRRSTMLHLSRITDSELEREKLLEFTRASGQEELFDYVNRPRRNILEVLNDFPNSTGRLTLRDLFEVMSPIKPRAYSIASSSLSNKCEVQVLVAVVKYRTRLVEPRLGLCSNYLASLQLGDQVLFWVEKGTFQFRYDQPMILIGPGTGLAPFRALLQERVFLGHELSDCLLFFGCRGKDKDFHCREELEKFVEKRDLKLFCAFSRDQQEKVYVQHLIRRENHLCWEFLKRGAAVYLAGNSKNMPQAVREEFVNLVNKCSGDLEAGEAFVRQLEKSNRYQTETWS